jgi:hypothetical protein
MSEELQMRAYYYEFTPTGVVEIDRILEAVARAGSAYHHTEYWSDQDTAHNGESFADFIQRRANEAAVALAPPSPKSEGGGE